MPVAMVCSTALYPVTRTQYITSVAVYVVKALRFRRPFGGSEGLPASLYHDAVDDPVSADGTMGRVLDILWPI